MKLSMCLFGALAMTFGITCAAQAGDKIPEGYKLVFQEDFEGKDALQNWVMTDPNAWRIEESEGNHVLSLFAKSKYEYVVRSPFNIALLGTLKVGDFVLEADLRQTGREYGHRDLCLFYNVQDPAHFYYTHIASVADPHAHNIFLVNNEPRTAIATKTTKGADWGQTTHKVRVERKVEEGTIKIFFDDMETPIMTATDKHFGEGYIGFGSFDDTGVFDNIKLWAPKVTKAKIDFFMMKD